MLMNRKMRWIRAIVMVVLFAGPALAQDKAKDKPQGNSDNAAPDTAAMNGAAKPGAPQAALAKLAGDYTTALKFFMQQGVAPAESSGSAKISVVLGGRFLLEENSSTTFGQAVSGLRMYGYNNVTKEYEAVWTYTMSTAMLKMAGTSSDGGKTIELSGTVDEPGMGHVPLHARIRQVDDNQFVVTLSSNGPDGKEVAFEETTYNRKK